MELRSKQTKTSLHLHLATAKNKLKPFLTAVALSISIQAKGLCFLAFYNNIKFEKMKSLKYLMVAICAVRNG
ncbi:hypothetical protein A9200_08725 [Maribacter hydrothermalis]|uniref:Uncharacterized protein n=1 Tax=Maribacter hydrothermalis TaxID=1836467 RepID=A0A1B7Z1A4_9FLAO|nr:hypothetical protein BTR34_12835 [Maribacter hydrothermalis]OBR36501.1 hypothetical protein A9200_08725 [Maribacter hydrothermalis]